MNAAIFRFFFTFST
ncbi:pheST operon leader peptide PheM [Escherichia coli]|nr:pheST operon leader peptide PheM [Escherichia coli]